MGKLLKMSFTSQAGGSPVRDPRLLAQARAVLAQPLIDIFARAVAHFDDALFDRAEHAGTSQLAFLDGMRELRRRHEEVAARFRRQLDRAWRALEDGEPLSAERVLAPETSGTLSLVSEHELESRLAAHHLASAIAREWRPVLARIDRRLGWIAGGLKLDADTNPLGPEHIGVAVHEAFATCDLAPEVRLVVIKLCERDLVAGLGKLYEALDQKLAESGVLPEIAAPRVRQKPRAAPPERMPPVPANGEPQEESDEGSQPPAWAQRFMERWAQSQAAAGPAPSAGGFAGAAGDLAVGGAQGVLLEALHHLLQERRGHGPAGGAAGGSQRALSQREMLSVLSLLQAAPSAALRAAIGDAGESLSQRLKSEVLSGATQLGVDPATAQLDPLDEDAIDLVGMLFDVMLDERDLAGRPRELIGRLVVPFVKVALLDRRMFVQKTHPARRLLNALAEACEGNTGETAAERALLGKVEEIVDRLMAEFNENLAIFLTLEEEFRDFLAQHRRRIEIAERRSAEIQRGQEKLQAARQRMAAELEARLAGRSLPQAIEDFLRQPWSHHVTMALLREGEQGEAFAEALALADGLLEELQEAQRHVVGKPWLQRWQAPLQRVFASVGMHPDIAAGAIDALHDTLQAVAAARPDLERDLPQLPPVALPQSAPEEPPEIRLVGGTDTLDFDNADADRIRALPLGTWLDFIDREGSVQAGKLSWVSPISKRLLFVNRRGVRFCVAAPEELAVMVRLGRLRPHLDDTPFDSAMQGVIDRLEPTRA